MTLFKKSLSALALAMGMVGAAQAAVITTTGSVGGAPNQPGVTYDNLDWLALGIAGGTNGGLTVVFTPDAAAVTGAVGGIYAAPFLSGGNGAGFGNADGTDATTYITTGSTGANPLAKVELTFATAQSYLGILWGSIDPYNTLSFYFGETLLDSITGTEVKAGANGDQGVNGTLYVNFLSDTPFNRVVATSSGYAFEFDNIAYSPSNPVPEPAMLALLGLGLVGVAAARRRQRPV